MNNYFKETQKFSQWWLWLTLIIILLFPIIGIIQQLIFKIKFGDKPMSDFGLIIFFLCTLAFIGFFKYIKLETELNNTGLKMSFVPFVKKDIKWEHIKSIKIVTYGFVGYGIRIGSSYGTVYNIKGNKGLAIKLKNGKKFLIGTQKTEDLSRLIKDLPINN